jgi:hypothetical protein
MIYIRRSCYPERISFRFRRAECGPMEASMQRIRLFLKHEASALPNLAWLEVTELLLKIAYDLFGWSKKLHDVAVLDWLANGLLRLALGALGHAPIGSRIELPADLPVQI